MSTSRQEPDDEQRPKVDVYDDGEALVFSDTSDPRAWIRSDTTCDVEP